MDWFIVIALLALGWLLLFLEIFFIPGTLLLIAVGSLLMAAGIYLAFKSFGSTAGTYTLTATVVAVGVSLALAFRTKFWTRMSLKDTNEARVNTIDFDRVQAGSRAVAVSRIAPSSKALFDDVVYEVHSESTFINENTPLEVVKIHHNKIIVKPLT